MRVDGTWQNIIFAAFLITWFGGGVAIYVRFLKRQLAYLRHFPPVDGVPLDTLQGGSPFGARSRATFRAMLQWQPDPEMERTRRDVRRRWLPVALWVYGFPILVICVIFGVAVLVRVARNMRLLP